MSAFACLPETSRHSLTLLSVNIIRSVRFNGRHLCFLPIYKLCTEPASAANSIALIRNMGIDGQRRRAYENKKKKKYNGKTYYYVVFGFVFVLHNALTSDRHRTTHGSCKKGGRGKRIAKRQWERVRRDWIKKLKQ